ncbi:hypothetical protein [Magnetovibrio sp.]|uniref:hypothetical protein n=1 Tax=Magnetovibrio sp. TaxID=2024836 RepID=UPI002F92D0B3
MNKNIKTYSIFHLNMSFSSIEENDRPVVLERCYWPLLQLIKDGYPLAVEATGLTLEHISEIDPLWIEELKRLVQKGKCEFVGSGYAQLIGPLVPHEVNVQNLRAGNAVYKELLGVEPALGLINEQAFSPSLVQTYLDAGYKAIIMDWANPHSQHSKEWSSSWRYYPQRALGVNGQSIPLIWVDSIPFQRFQRYVHGEIDIEDMFEYLMVDRDDAVIAFPLYGNDAEIFDYRPGRFATEPAIETENEWHRMRDLLDQMSATGHFEFVHPSVVLSLKNQGLEGNLLSLESPDDPIPVKKQPKYNILRWAATGRDDVWANTACWRAFNRLSSDENTTDQQWRNLCRLWSSDYRTHITETRWRDYISELADFGAFGERSAVFKRTEDVLRVRKNDQSVFRLEQDRRYLTVCAPSGTLRLRLMRGLAIEGFWVAGNEQSFLRTLPHGYFFDINWGADFYSGHLIAQIIGRPQVTDLEKVEPTIFLDPDNRFIDVEAHVSTLAGPLFKRVRFFAHEPRVEVRYRVDWIEGVQGSVRFANITLNPACFDRSSLFYAVHNGGPDMERYSLAEQDIDHMRAPSFLVSARAATGMTQGRLIIGDATNQVLLECPRDVAAMPALVTCKAVDDLFFCRVALSAREIDDTAKLGPYLPMPGRNEYMFAMTALSGTSNVA